MIKLQKIRKIDETEYEWEDTTYRTLLKSKGIKRYRYILKKLCKYYRVPIIEVRRTKLHLSFFHNIDFVIYLTYNVDTILDLLHEFSHYIQYIKNYPEVEKEKHYHNEKFRDTLKKVIKVYRENHI